MYIHTLARFCESQGRFSLLLSLKYYILFFLSVCSLPAPAVCSEAAVPFVLSSLSPLPPSGAPLKLSGGLLCVVLCVVLLPAFSVCRLPLLSVTRQPSGARRCDSVGRCTACMSPALSPLAYVLPLVVLLSVPCLVLLPAAVCRQVVIIAYTPLCPGRRLCGAASEV